MDKPSIVKEFRRKKWFNILFQAKTLKIATIFFCAGILMVNFNIGFGIYTVLFNPFEKSFSKDLVYDPVNTNIFFNQIRRKYFSERNNYFNIPKDLTAEDLDNL